MYLYILIDASFFIYVLYKYKLIFNCLNLIALL